MNKESAIEFPCYFPIKIIGINKASFQKEITDIIQHYASEENPPKITLKPSKEDRYLSITATVYVMNQETLDNIYQEITKHPDIKMVL